MRFYSKLEDNGNFWVVYCENGPRFPLTGESLRNVKGMTEEVERLVKWLNADVADIDR